VSGKNSQGSHKDIRDVIVCKPAGFRNETILRRIIAHIHFVGAVDDAEADLMLPANQVERIGS
jgi:hypothetical protein